MTTIEILNQQTAMNTDALPYPEIYDRVVTVGVDFQNDFAPDGVLGVPNGDRAIPVFNRVAAWTRARRGVVAFTADWHPEETAHFDTWPVHCVRETPGAAFHQDIDIHPAEDYVLRKGAMPDEDAYSGFEATNGEGDTLKDLIHPSKETVALLIGGWATDYCVKATALDGITVTRGMRYVDVYVVEDAIAGVDVQAGDSDRAIEEMKAAGVRFIRSEDLLDGKIMETTR